MTRARMSWLALALVLALSFSFLKLFTYHYVLSDDPTTGLALRATPALDNGPSILADRDLVLFGDENGFIGEDLYAAFSHAGWLVAVAAPLALAWLFRNGRKPARGAS